ncbi:MAG: 3-deoxy-D-manno-octulosonic acid transferase, partial [Janthinobacterium sp.]
TLVAAQTQDDADRVRQLGVRDVVVTGRIKFDVVVPEAALATGAALRGAIGARPVLLCASTREGEEQLILDAYIRASLPAHALLLIVPRHPQRFDEVEKLIAAQGLAVQRRSGLGQDDAVAQGTQVLLGDSMGEMFAYYAACDCAFVGGSLLPLGGQNLIEPAALGKPVLIGPHTFNFALVTEQAIAAGGAALVSDADALMAQAAVLLQDPARLSSMGERALAFASQHRGATPRTIAAIKPLLP